MTVAMLLLPPAACSGGDDTLVVSGTVEIRELRLAPLAAGRLTRVLHDEGDTVAAGDTIAVLEQPGLDALIEQRRAQAGAAAARVAEVAAAWADSERAARDFARAEPLAHQGVISEQQYEAVRAAPIESRAAAAAFEGALAIRDQLTVLAPAPGVVLGRYAEPGEVVAAGTPVAALGVVGEPWVRAFVGERFLSRVAPGAAVVVRLDGDAAHPLTGRVTTIAPRAEFTPRAALTERERADLVFAVRVDVDDPDRRLKAGLPVTLEIALLP